MAPPTRVRTLHIHALVAKHGVARLAKKLGVDERSVRRWHNDTVAPSPLAREKLLAAHKELQQTADTKDAPATGPTRRLPLPGAGSPTTTAPQRSTPPLPPPTPRRLGGV